MYQIIRTLSSKNKLLRTPRVRTTKYHLNSVKYAGAIQWNSIPPEICESNSINGFKTMLKKHLISGYYTCDFFILLFFYLFYNLLKFCCDCYC